MRPGHEVPHALGLRLAQRLHLGPWVRDAAAVAQEAAQAHGAQRFGAPEDGAQVLFVRRLVFAGRVVQPAGDLFSRDPCRREFLAATAGLWKR